MRVGAQVTSITDGFRDGLTLCLRFCRLPDAAGLVIYRFLDRRRQLWQADAAVEKPVPPLRPPFEKLLLEAFHTLRIRERGRRRPSRDLLLLSRILGRTAPAAPRRAKAA